jgi:hypothetical protein
MDKYLANKRVLYKDFGKHVEKVSELLKTASLSRAEREGRPIQYLTSSSVSKEEVAQQIAERDHIERGLICVLSCGAVRVFRHVPVPGEERVAVAKATTEVPTPVPLLETS